VLGVDETDGLVPAAVELGGTFDACALQQEFRGNLVSLHELVDSEPFEIAEWQS
jgi:hypothetical protein